MQPQRRSRVPALLMFQDGNYRNIWYAGVLIEISRRLELLVLSIFVLSETNSPFQLLLVLVFLNLPRPVVSIFTGAVADRFSRRRILMVAQCLNMLIAAGMLTLFVSEQIQPWHVFVAVALQGCSKSLEDPARRTGIFDIVGQSRVVTAMSLEMLSNTFGMMAGPILAGVLISVRGSDGAYGFVLVVHLLALGLLLRVKIPSQRVIIGKERVLSSLVVAIRYALHSRMLLGALYITILMNALSFPTAQVIPAIGLDQLGVGPVLVGLLVASAAFGQLFTAGIIASMRSHQYHGRMFVVGSLVSLVMAVLFVWSPWYALSFAIWTVFGIGQTGFGVMQSSIIMLWSPRDMRGRMLGLMSMCIGIGTPSGAAEIGALALVLGIPWAVSVNGLAALLLILPVLALTPLVWRPSREPPPEATQG